MTTSKEIENIQYFDDAFREILNDKDHTIVIDKTTGSCTLLISEHIINYDIQKTKNGFAAYFETNSNLKFQRREEFKDDKSARNFLFHLRFDPPMR
jgi:hypothetical protein